jgi:hypothetical protein
MLKGPITVTTTGGDGSASGSATLGHDLERMFLMGVKIDYNASAPETTDVTITEVGGLGQTILTLTDVNTDGFYYPRAELDGPTGAALGMYELLMLEGDIQVEVAQCNAFAEAVSVTLQFLDNKEIR